MAEAVPTIRLSLAGSAATRSLDVLAARGGSVLAVFRRSLYLADADGGIVCVGPPGLGAGPLNALGEVPQGLDWQRRGLAPGKLVTPIADGFRIRGAIEVATRDAAAYRPRGTDLVWSRDRLHRALDALAAAAEPYGRTDGLAPLVVAPEHDPTPLIVRARRSIGPLTSWLLDGLTASVETEPPIAAIEQLLGLGPGLTPSGDDFLGGAMIALHASRHGLLARRLARGVLDHAAALTGRISLAHLACAADGEGAAALHDSLAALHGADEIGLGRGLKALDAIGHSSGWDALAGARLALGCLAESLGGQVERSAAATSAASALDDATMTPAVRKVSN